jgi:PEP-CTERM motif
MLKIFAVFIFRRPTVAVQFFSAAALAVGLWSHAAKAEPVDLPGVNASADVSVDVVLDPGESAATPDPLPYSLSVSGDNIDGNPGSGSAAASVTGGLDPGISVSASAENGDYPHDGHYPGTYEADASAQLNYDFQVAGPGQATTSNGTVASGNTIIPVASTDGFAPGQLVDIAGAGDAGTTLVATIESIDSTNKTLTINTATSTQIGAGNTVATAVEVLFQGDSSASTEVTNSYGSSSADASITLSDPNDNPIYSPLTGAAFDTMLYLDLGSIYNIDMQANARVQAFSSDGGLYSASASVDPTLTVNGPYTINYSPGLLGATPLPATWPLMLSGLGVFGLLACRRRKTRYAAIGTA